MPIIQPYREIWPRIHETAYVADGATVTVVIDRPYYAEIQLQVSGYGDHSEAVGTWQFGATLSVLRGRPGVAEGVSVIVEARAGLASGGHR